MGWGWGRGRAGTSPPPLDPGPPTLRPLPFKVLGRNSPAPPGKGGGGVGELGLVRAAGGRDIEITLPSTHGGLRSRPGQSSVPRGVEGELLGGMRLNWLEGKEKRAGALEPKQLSIQCRPVWGVGGVGRSGLLKVSHGAVRSTNQTLFPSEPEPLLVCPAQPPTPQPGPVCCADLTSAKSGDSRGH